MLIVMGWLAGGSHAWQGMGRSDGFPALPGGQQRWQVWLPGLAPRAARCLNKASQRL